MPSAKPPQCQGSIGYGRQRIQEKAERTRELWEFVPGPLAKPDSQELLLRSSAPQFEHHLQSTDQG